MAGVSDLVSNDYKKSKRLGNFRIHDTKLSVGLSLHMENVWVHVARASGGAKEQKCSMNGDEFRRLCNSMEHIVRAVDRHQGEWESEHGKRMEYPKPEERADIVLGAEDGYVSDEEEDESEIRRKPTSKGKGAGTVYADNGKSWKDERQQQKKRTPKKPVANRISSDEEVEAKRTGGGKKKTNNNNKRPRAPADEEHRAQQSFRKKLKRAETSDDDEDDEAQ